MEIDFKNINHTGKEMENSVQSSIMSLINIASYPCIRDKIFNDSLLLIKLSLQSTCIIL